MVIFSRRRPIRYVINQCCIANSLFTAHPSGARLSPYVSVRSTRSSSDFPPGVRASRRNRRHNCLRGIITRIPLGSSSLYPYSAVRTIAQPPTTNSDLRSETSPTVASCPRRRYCAQLERNGDAELAGDGSLELDQVFWELIVAPSRSSAVVGRIKVWLTLGDSKLSYLLKQFNAVPEIN